MNKKLPAFIFGLLLFIAAASQACAGNLEPQEILKKASYAVNYAGSGKINNVKKTILDAQGRRIEQNYQTVRFKDKKGNIKRLIFFMDDSRYLSQIADFIWQNFNANNIDQLTQNIVRTMQELSLENDLEGEISIWKTGLNINRTAEHYEIVDSSNDFYLIKGFSDKSLDLGYDHYYIWILNNTFIPVAIEFFDEEGLLVRLIEVHEIKNIQGLPTITKLLVDNVRQGERITINYRDVIYEKGLYYPTNGFALNRYSSYPLRWSKNYRPLYR